jgi:Arginine methyltransferase oligomerization subdomain/Ribosomal protein L11 methyltransferase (PrmA)
MYSLDDFGEMIGDKLRFSAYAEAIQRAVKPGDIVADIGSGPGILGFLACRAGASRVFAIERDSIVEFARQLAAVNGLSDHIEFFNSDSGRTRLPERVNVIVSDLRGALPFFAEAIATLNDARQRFLAAGGILIPQRDVLYAAVVATHERYDRILAPWRQVLGLNLDDCLHSVLNAVHATQLKPEHLVSDPQSWCTLNYAEGANCSGEAHMRFPITRTSRAHGLCIWFETHLYDNIGFSTGPSSEETVYGHVFLPWLAPVDLIEGEEVQVELHADPVGSDYVWRWETRIGARDARPEIHFRQSTFYGANFAPSALKRRAAEFSPALSEEGQAECWILQAMNGTASLQEIALGAATRYPSVFPQPEDALRRAGELAVRYSR